MITEEQCVVLLLGVGNGMYVGFATITQIILDLN
jgi:hypothetical protein